MKKLFLLLITFISFTPLFSQTVPNGGFESWTSGIPDNWLTSNVLPIVVTVTQSAAAHSGSSSARGDVINFSGTTLGPLLQTGVAGSGFPISQRFASCTGYYQFNSVLGDRLQIVAFAVKSRNPVAAGELILNPAAGWTQFNIDLQYLSADTPDTAYVQIAIIGPTSSNDLHVGSYFLLDDVDLSGTATYIKDPSQDPEQFSLDQNYPNPFNPSTKITFNLPEKSFVSLKVYNTIGKEVASVIDGVLPAGTHEINFNAANLFSGVYFYTLKAGDKFSQTKKMILLK